MENFILHFRCKFCKEKFNESRKYLQHLEKHKEPFEQNIMLAVLRRKKLEAKIIQSHNLKDDTFSNMAVKTNIIHTKNEYTGMENTDSDIAIV